MRRAQTSMLGSVTMFIRLRVLRASVLVCLLAATLLASSASAQDAPKFFADGIAYLGIEQFDHTRSDGPGSVSDDPSGTVGGGTVGVGTFLTPHVSVRFEASFESGISTTVSLALPYAELTRLTTLSTLPPLPTAVFVPDRRQEMHHRTFAALAAYHQGGGRVGVAYLAGLAIVQSEQRSTYSSPVIPTLLAGSILPASYDARYTSYTNSPIVGVDVDIEVGDHIRLIPEIRALALDGLVIIRPGIGLRWRP